jgi:hypothetical protein
MRNVPVVLQPLPIVKPSAGATALLLWSQTPKICQPRSRLRTEPLLQVSPNLPRAVHTLRNRLGE